MQRAHLNPETAEDREWDVRFLAVYHDSDAVHLESCKTHIAGKAVSQWWDRCEEAGPKSRVAERFQEELPTLDFLTVSGGELKNHVFI